MTVIDPLDHAADLPPGLRSMLAGRLFDGLNLAEASEQHLLYRAFEQLRRERILLVDISPGVRRYRATEWGDLVATAAAEIEAFEDCDNANDNDDGPEAA